MPQARFKYIILAIINSILPYTIKYFRAAALYTKLPSQTFIPCFALLRDYLLCSYKALQSFPLHSHCSDRGKLLYLQGQPFSFHASVFPNILKHTARYKPTAFILISYKIFLIWQKLFFSVGFPTSRLLNGGLNFLLIFKTCVDEPLVLW